MKEGASAWVLCTLAPDLARSEYDERRRHLRLILRGTRALERSPRSIMATPAAVDWGIGAAAIAALASTICLSVLERPSPHLSIASWMPWLVLVGPVLIAAAAYCVVERHFQHLPRNTLDWVVGLVADYPALNANSLQALREIARVDGQYTPAAIRLWHDVELEALRAARRSACR